ncbi:MAG TPA: tail fiber protein [Solirubrobacteraceae bacterium]|jgi:microcystin-dependent protein
MGAPYIGEIRMFGGTFAPVGWAFCDGTPLSIAQYDTLYSVIGTTYGGDGETTFSLPDLRGRVPVHQGKGQSTYVLGESGGLESVTLTAQATPAHTHPMMATTQSGSQSNPSGNILANSQGLPPYIQEDPSASLNPAMLAQAGGSQPHDNRQPYVGINFIISLYGIYPTPG